MTGRYFEAWLLSDDGHLHCKRYDMKIRYYKDIRSADVFKTIKDETEQIGSLLYDLTWFIYGF